MPLTPFQREVARILAAHRNPESYLTGGAVINRSDASFRYSNDLDVFHDAAVSVAACAEADARALRAANCSVEWALRQEDCYRAEASRGEDRVRLDWSTPRLSSSTWRTVTPAFRRLTCRGKCSPGPSISGS